jgi:hypothetical protein
VAGRAGVYKKRIVAFKLPKKDADKLSEYPHLVEKPIRCRFIKVVLEKAEVESLCTCLVDKIKYRREELLYHYPWNEEQAYKLLKSRIELEAFSGKTAKAVKQDFYAKLFLMPPTAA